MTASSLPPKGLVSVSLLKALFDEHKDHLEMFVPLVLDAIHAYAVDDFSSQEMVHHVHNHDGLDIPTGTMDAILARIRQSGIIRRDGGRFFVDREKAAGCDLSIERARAAADQEHLARALMQFTKDQGFPQPPDVESALAVLVRFLDRNQMVLLLDDGSASHVQDDELLDREARAVAHFILEECISDRQLAGCLRSMVEGFVLQNVLLLRDFGSATRNFQNLTVFLDTTFLFALLGIRGPAAQQAAAETTTLLRGLDSRLGVFASTLQEMRRILYVYESKLGTSAGRSSLHPREETRFFLTNRYTPAQVRELSALLEHTLSHSGVDVVSMPFHIAEFTLDEAALGKRLMRSADDSEDPRVLNDVDCVSAVMTLRAGRRPRSIDTARAILATTASLFVRNTTAWYRDAGEGGIPPVIHVAALTSIAWLKKPAGAEDLKMHELIALCGAALRPTQAIWQRFMKYLSDATKDGLLTTDETVAILASELTDAQLCHVADTADDVDATTIAEVVERVKAHYRENADAEIAVASVRVMAIEQAAQKDREKAAAELAQRDARLAAAEAQLLEGSRKIADLRADLKLRAWRLANGAMQTIFWLLAPLLAYALLVLAFAGLAPPGRFQQFLWPFVVCVVTLSVAGLLWGTSLAAVRDRMTARLAAWIAKRILSDSLAE